MGDRNADIGDDFQFIQEDLGETIQLTHRISQTLNVTSGDFVGANEVVPVVGVVSKVSEKKISLSPHKLTKKDRIFRFRKRDITTTSGVFVEGDIVQHNSIDYKAVEVDLQKEEIYRVVGKRTS